MSTIPESLPHRLPSILVPVAPGLWIARPQGEPSEPETVEQRERRRITPRAVFSRPLVPRRLRAAETQATGVSAERDEPAREPR